LAFQAEISPMALVLVTHQPYQIPVVFKTVLISAGPSESHILLNGQMARLNLNGMVKEMFGLNDNQIMDKRKELYTNFLTFLEQTMKENKSFFELLTVQFTHVYNAAKGSDKEEVS
jgi:hypothetical protein